VRPKLYLGVAALAAGALAASSPAAAPPKKVVARDWSRTVAPTPAGGFQMGNPKAKVRLIEYGSLTCSHCRQFAKTGADPLIRNYVRTGRVSYEFRNYVRDGADVAVGLVARCGGAARFFPMADALYDKQPEWLAKIIDLPQAEQEKLEALPEPQRLQRLAEISGALNIAAGKGIAPAKAKACIADKAGLDRLVKMRAQGDALGVPGTPTFFINGKKADAFDWPSLEPLLKAAGG
jgi:protein-disulfide isomerase